MQNIEIKVFSTAETNSAMQEIVDAIVNRGHRVHDFGVRGSGGLIEPDSHADLFNLYAIKDSDGKDN